MVISVCTVLLNIFPLIRAWTVCLSSFMQMLLTLWTCLFRCTCVAIPLQAHLYGCAYVDACLAMHLCRNVCTCSVDLHLWVQPCGHASAGKLCGLACSGAFKMPLQMNLCRHASAGNLCGFECRGTWLDMSWQMPPLVHLSCLFTFT